VPRSFTATISISGRSHAIFKNARPILPNPLIATLITPFVVVFVVVSMATVYHPRERTLVIDIPCLYGKVKEKALIKMNEIMIKEFPPCDQRWSAALWEHAKELRFLHDEDKTLSRARN